MSYLDWNNRLARYFFNEEMAGREVLLYANRQIVNAVCEGLGDFSDFINILKSGPPRATRSGFCQKAYQAYEGWRQRNLEYPPYIAYLVFFVLVEDTEGDFAPHAYYPRFWRLLGEEGERRPSSFDRMWELWADLEKWSREEKNEELGRFTFRVRGGYDHVGLPLSQTLLSFEERGRLPLIFDASELDPTDPPAPDTLKKLLLHHGGQGHFIERRTIRLLEATDAESLILINALLEFILEELTAWDGTVPEIDTEEKGITKKAAKTGLRICLSVDDVARSVKTYLRFKTNRPIPDNGLNFQGADYAGVLTCFEACTNWSSSLKEQATSRQMDASVIDWLKEFHLKDPDNNWHAKLRGTNVRLIIPGRREGLPDWIESQHLERNTEFMIATHSSMISVIKNWGEQFCDGFKEKPYSGLPAGWSLFYGKNARKSCEGAEVLTLSELLRVRLEGGIKTGRGNTYLKFGLPSIILENVAGNEKIKIDNRELAREDENIPQWRIRGNFPVNEPLRIEVFREGTQPLQTRIIKIEDPQIPDRFDSIPCRDLYGSIMDAQQSGSCIRGALVEGTFKEKCLAYVPSLPTHLSSRIVFIGTRPGEIADWPEEDLPSAWHPVWAIAKEGSREWSVHFCGLPGHLAASHVPGRPLTDRDAVKKWKEFVWVHRRRNKEPSLRQLRTVWKKYLDDARNA